MYRHEPTETTPNDDDGNTCEVEKDIENYESESDEIHEDGYLRNRTFENPSLIIQMTVMMKPNVTYVTSTQM